MYKVILSSALVFLLSGSLTAQAQMADRLAEHPTFSLVSVSTSADEDALVITRAMSNRLRLNEGQFISLLALNRTRLVNLKSIARQYGSDAAARAAKVAELEAQFEHECSRILTPSQLSQLQQGNDQQPIPNEPGHGVG